MYYDDYPSSPSTGASSSSTRLRPSLPGLATLGHSSHSTQRGSKACDMAHLLDPSYSPSRAHCDNQMIYVDHAGEAHDPDFRLFAPASYSPKRREFLAFNTDSDLGGSDDDDDDNDNEPAAFRDRADADSAVERVARFSPRRSSFDSYRSASPRTPGSISRPTSRASDPLYSRGIHAEFAYAPFNYTYDATGYVSEEEPRRESNKLRRRRISLEQQQRQQPEFDDFEDDVADVVGRAYPEQRHEEPTHASYSPTQTCSHAFRRQWHALRLRTQVAAFRARKRMFRIVSPTAG